MTWLRWTVAALLPCLPCFSSDRPEQIAGEKITLREGFPFVDVMVNGRGPFRMLIDTGANASLLTPAAARKAELTFDHRVILTTFAGERVVPGASTNVIQVGGTVESGLPILVMDMPDVQLLNDRTDGVLGQSFLSRNPYLLDYEKKRLWLGLGATVQAARLPNSVIAVSSQGRTVLPVALEPGGAVWQLALDSGSTHLVLDCSTRCPEASGIQHDSRLVTHTGQREVRRGTLRHVELGGQQMPASDAVLLENVVAGWDDGVLPTRWFSAFYVSSDVVRFAPAR